MLWWLSLLPLLIVLQENRIHAVQFVKCDSRSNFSLFFVFGLRWYSAYLFVPGLALFILVVLVLLLFLLNALVLSLICRLPYYSLDYRIIIQERLFIRVVSITLLLIFDLRFGLLFVLSFNWGFLMNVDSIRVLLIFNWFFLLFPLFFLFCLLLRLILSLSLSLSLIFIIYVFRSKIFLVKYIEIELVVVISVLFFYLIIIYEVVINFALLLALFLFYYARLMVPIYLSRFLVLFFMLFLFLS